MIWYDMIWYDMIWYDMIWFNFAQNRGPKAELQSTIWEKKGKKHSMTKNKAGSFQPNLPGGVAGISQIMEDNGIIMNVVNKSFTNRIFFLNWKLSFFIPDAYNITLELCDIRT